MTNILIADDHALVRQGVKQIVSSHFPAANVGEAGSARDLLDQIQTTRWDTLILDIALPDRNGLDVLVDIKKMTPALPVLVLSVYPEDQLAIRLLKMGASGYLCKQSAPDDLAVALTKIANGGRYISPPLAERLAMDVNGRLEQQPHEALSDREYQTLCMLAGGKTTMEISQDLLLAPSTVSTYRTRVLRKLRLRKRSELVQYALHHHLIH
jgi:two-component system, NarL family, invasion response regulator UvrY